MSRLLTLAAGRCRPTTWRSMRASARCGPRSPTRLGCRAGRPDLAADASGHRRPRQLRAPPPDPGGGLLGARAGHLQGRRRRLRGRARGGGADRPQACARSTTGRDRGRARSRLDPERARWRKRSSSRRASGRPEPAQHPAAPGLPTQGPSPPHGAAVTLYLYRWTGVAETAVGCAARLRPTRTRRSVTSIVSRTFTLFNAIIRVFFLLVLSLGLFADALFGFIAIVNSAIGIRQELKAKEDARQPRPARRARRRRSSATAAGRPPRRRGRARRRGPGRARRPARRRRRGRRLARADDRRVAAHRRGGRDPQDPATGVLSGSFCVSGSGYYEIDAVREESQRGRRSPARLGRSATRPAPLEEEVNQVLRATTIVLVPLAVVVLSALSAREPRDRGGRPDRHRRARSRSCPRASSS